MLRTSEAVLARLTTTIIVCQQARCGVCIDGDVLADLIADVAEAYRRQRLIDEAVARFENTLTNKERST